jgi:hypothetical protein
MAPPSGTHAESGFLRWAAILLGSAMLIVSLARYGVNVVILIEQYVRLSLGACG